MPDNQIPATQAESGVAPGELNFIKPAPENPRIKRRSLKAKEPHLIKPSASLPAAARELAREAPPLSAEEAAEEAKRAASHRAAEAPQPAAAAKTISPAPAPPRSAPSPATAKLSPSATGVAAPKVGANSGPTSSPHGTRPATLYYSSYPRKDKEVSSPMKSTPIASPAPSSSATTTPASAARPAAAAPRAAAPVDYRANVERQAREQKSVGNVLAYVVYALIAFFVLTAALAGYGASVIFKQIHDQSLTVSDLDQRYAKANEELNAKLTGTQETLDEARAQVNRQQELILKQQDEINRLIGDTTDNANALKLERQVRAQETAILRGRLRDIEYRANTTTTQKY